MIDRTGRIAEIIVALIIITFAAALLFDGRNLASNPFEPLGSKTIPGVAAWLAIALGAIVMGEALRGLRQSSPAGALAEKWGAVAFSFLATVVYVIVLASGHVRYQWATMLFIPAVTLAVADDRRKALPWALGLGVAYGLGIDYIFRHLLVTNIP